MLMTGHRVSSRRAAAVEADEIGRHYAGLGGRYSSLEEGLSGRKLYRRWLASIIYIYF